MPSDRSLVDRVIKGFVPRADGTYLPPPQQLCAGLWILERRLRHLGLALLPSRTTLLRLPDESLVVISPPALVDSRTRAAIDSIGSVGYVVIPNSFHYLYASDFMHCYPGAALLAAPGLRRRVPDLDVEAELGTRSPEAWAGVLDYLVLEPRPGVAEVLFFHAPTGTLILTDLAFNMTRYPRPVDRLLWRLSGIPRGFGPGRTSRALLLNDRAVASRALARAAEWPITRIVMAHGDPIDRDASARFRRAFSRYLHGEPDP